MNELYSWSVPLGWKGGQAALVCGGGLVDGVGVDDGGGVLVVVEVLWWWWWS